jgi:hypothetical protein
LDTLARVIYAAGFSRWTRSPLRLCFPDKPVGFISNFNRVPDVSVLVVWGGPLHPRGDGPQHGGDAHRGRVPVLGEIV